MIDLHVTQTTARSGETVYLGDLVRVCSGVILRRATKEDLGVPVGVDVREHDAPPPDDICIWNGHEAVPFQQAMGQVVEVDGSTGVSRAPHPPAQWPGLVKKPLDGNS